MDWNQDSRPEGLEDQVRRMILHNESQQPPPVHTNQPQQPIVRLPPSHNAHSPHTFSPNSNEPSQQWRHSASGFQQGPMPNGQHHPMNHGGPHHPRGRGGHRQPRQANQHSDFHYGQQNMHQQQQFGSAPSMQQRARFQQQMQLDPNAFQRRGFGPAYGRPNAGPQHLFNPNTAPRQFFIHPSEQHARQEQHLEQLAAAEISQVEMGETELREKEDFRHALEQICHQVCELYPQRLPKVSLQCFGSFQSGFAFAGSDMDLVIVVEDSSPTSACVSLLENDLPRMLEKRLLELGYGARLLTRTRVPIIKVCEKPGEGLLSRLVQEREKWDCLSHEVKYPHLYTEDDEDQKDDAEKPVQAAGETQPIDKSSVPCQGPSLDIPNAPDLDNSAASSKNPTTSPCVADEIQDAAQQETSAQNGARHPPNREHAKTWTRERKAGPLDFANSGVGIQSDINFFNPLGLHNTQMLRCYSLCDPRVRPMVLFVKAWAKRRKINSSYSGTLSSYGYVLMVLHYLVNVAQPPVVPNLQASWRPAGVAPADRSKTFMVEGWSVSFWHDADEIHAAAQKGLLTANRESLGSLLAGFFQYYSSQGGGATFRWMQEVLSLRSPGGLITKDVKGWVKAVTEEGEGKKIQHRYLFCIEDPFELNHNVARTVTHNGIVAIRDEFRRARRILLAIGNGQSPRDGELFAQLMEEEDLRKAKEVILKGDPPVPVPNIDGTADTPMSAKSHGPEGDPHNGNPQPSQQNSPKSRSEGRNRRTQTPRSPKQRNGHVSNSGSRRKSLDVNDSEAFPSLATAKPSKKKHSPTLNEDSEHWGEISGDKARLVLEEVKRKKDEAQAEFTATGAAEAVLGDSD